LSWKTSLRREDWARRVDYIARLVIDSEKIADKEGWK